jgi:hypothetical protein
VRVLDLFAGLEGWSAPFRARDHDVISVDIDPRFDVSLDRRADQDPTIGYATFQVEADAGVRELPVSDGL